MQIPLQKVLEISSSDLWANTLHIFHHYMLIIQEKS